jgi:hypothetical protein
LDGSCRDERDCSGGQNHGSPRGWGDGTRRGCRSRS